MDNKQKECNMDTRTMHLWPRCWRQGLGLTALTLLLALSAPVLATTQFTPFELDADPQDNQAGTPSDDWATPPSSGSAVFSTGILQDNAPRSIFGGGNKDIEDISAWSWKDGSVPDKDELTHAYAAAYREDTDLLLYFGADRIANAGDAFMGFWFFKEKVENLAGGKFSGNHQKGDTLILMNFPQASGAKPEMAVVMWDPACSRADGNTPTVDKCIAPNLRLKRYDVGSPNSNQTCQGTGNLACALTNDDTVDIPALTVSSENGGSGLWSDYTPKSGPQGTFPFESFFEGGINLTKILAVAGDTNPVDNCFSSFLAETRSSSSFTAQLKDFVLGNFDLCSIDISKLCTSGDINTAETAFTYEFEGNVTNSGLGALYNVEIIDDNATPGDPSDDFQVGATIPVLAAGQVMPYDGSFESAGNGPTNSVKVMAASSSGDNVEKTVTATFTAEPCPTIRRPPGIDVTKSCETKVIFDDVNDRLVVRVDFKGDVCNTTGGSSGVAPISLNNVVLTDQIGNGPETTIKTIPQLKAGECVTYEGSYTPATSPGSENPGDIAFSDVVRATGTAPLGFGTATDSATATCPLCPDCPDCPTN